MDPDLVRRVRSGEYVVDAQAIAGAILGRGGLDAPSSEVLPAPQPDLGPLSVEQLDALSLDDLA